MAVYRREIYIFLDISWFFINTTSLRGYIQLSIDVLRLLIQSVDEFVQNQI